MRVSEASVESERIELLRGGPDCPKAPSLTQMKNGTMSSKTKDKFRIDNIARSLESIRVPGTPGTFDGRRFDDLRTVFLTSIAWDERLPEAERERIASKAIFEAASHGKITTETLLGSLRTIENHYFAQPVRDFVVVASLSLRYFKPLQTMRVGDVHLSFHPEMPNTFSRKGLHGLAWGCVSDTPNGYVTVCAKVSEKSAYTAHSIAESALEVLRGIWNYEGNRSTSSILRIGGSGKWEVLNKIRRGPIDTVHLPDGSLAVQEWWQIPFSGPSQPGSFAEKWPQMRKTTLWCLRRGNEIPYQEELTAMWGRYAHALDDPDPEACFLKLWSLLELVTGTKGANYDEMIRRTLFVCKDRDFHQLILEHLRDRRNALVHSDDGSPQIQACIFQLKRYVEEFIRLHLALGWRFKTISEFGEFFSLPFEPSMLKAKRQLYGWAFSFREKTLRHG